MTRQRPLDLERIGHVPGEMLRHRDLRDQLTYDVELLLWHQRAVHEPGVVEGLAVGWQPGDASVSVEPGLAYDGRGRPLHVLSRRAVALPADGDPSALLLRFAEGAREAELVWRPLRSLEPCDGIPLALLDQGVVTPRTTGTRSLARPRVGAGETQAEATAWGLWIVDVLGGQAIGLETRVDTSPAGFTDVPCYFAWLNWPRPGKVITTRAHPDVRTLGLQYVQDETARSFAFRVAFRRFRGEDELLGFARRERLSVCWLGVQCDHDTPSIRRKRRRHVPVL
jgi:hypothetical protein